VAKHVRTIVTVLAVGWLLGAGAARGGSSAADGQLSFAHELLRAGETQFAILEFRRFAHLYPDDPRAPDARLAVASVYLEQLSDIRAARRELTLIVEKHPKTPAAARAQQLDAFIKANHEANYRPLLLYLGAASARERGELDESLKGLDELLKRYPKARLVPQALILRARALEDAERYDDAIAAYTDIRTRYPNTSLVPRALYGQATATESRDGAKPHVAELYRQVVALDPKGVYGKRASERLETLERRADALERTFPAKDVQPFTLLEAGYPARPTRYEVRVEVKDGLAENQLKATLEDALVKQYAKRTDPAHSVRVEAQSPTGQSLGRVAWAPRKKPSYEIEGVGKEDMIRDILQGMFR